jgi:hypothetical protein
MRASRRVIAGIAVACLLAFAAGQDPAKPVAPDGASGAKEVERAFLAHDVHLDLARGLCWIPVTIDVREDLLEYLLVNPKGAAHESLFTTEVVPSRLNLALLALGVEAGHNAKWTSKEPPPTEEEMQNGALPYVVEPPSGDGFYLYAGWREGTETYFYRVDDLLRDLETGRSMRRHAWVFLGSRVVRMRTRNADPKDSSSKDDSSRKSSTKEVAPKEGPTKEVFAADVEGNLVNIAFFEEGNTLVTAALPECLKQTIWLANGWLLPQRGAPVALLFSRRPLEAPPEGMAAAFPEVSDGEGR